MADITLRTARTTFENAVIDQLQYQYGARLPVAADIPTLRGMASTGVPDRSMRFVTAKNFAYQFKAAALGTDDGDTTVQPTDVTGALPGRWIKTASTVATGYLIRCELYNDDSANLDTLEHRIFGDVPAMLLSFERAEHEPKSTEAGAIYWVRYHFTLFVISVDQRGGQTARQGSPLAAEAAADPGTGAMLGDAKAALAGVLGEDLGLPDIAYIQIEDEYPVIRDLARRRFLEALDLIVFATLTNPDSANVVTLADPFEFNMQLELADGPASGTFDITNEVQSDGLRFALGDGLNQAYAGGAVVINGGTVNVPAGNRTFTANKVTYRDINAAGTIVYTETNYGDDQPTPAAGYQRLGVTFSDSTGVRLDRLLMSTLVNFGPVNLVEHGLLTSIDLSPLAVSIPHGTVIAFTALGTYADGFQQDITLLVAWASSNQTVATIAANGFATTLVTGSTNITATLGSVSSTAPAVLTAT